MIDRVKVKSILNKHKKRDEWFLDDYSVNPYKGCSFNCVYCYIKGYGMAKDLQVKVNAPEILEKQLRRRAKKGEYGIIALSTSTEPYQKIGQGLTTRLLKIIADYRFPVHVLTKSDLVSRDAGLLKEIDERAIMPRDLEDRLEHAAIVNFSFSTLDEGLARLLEPGAPRPKYRLRALERLKDEGLMVGISYIPALPFISDSEDEIEGVIKTAREFGADFVFVGSLTLFGEQKRIFYSFLERRYPDLLPKYKRLYRTLWAPPKDYQLRIEEKARELCNRYGIRLGLLRNL